METADKLIDAKSLQAFEGLMDERYGSLEDISDLRASKADKTDVTTPFSFRGSCLYADLPVTGVYMNDTYYVTDKKCRYTWNGAQWYQSSLNEADYTEALKNVIAEESQATDDTKMSYVLGTMPVELPTMDEFNAVTEHGKNFWSGSNEIAVSGWTSIPLSDHIPAGTYAVSVEIESTDTDATKSRLQFITSTGTVSKDFNRGDRGWLLYQLTSPATELRLYSANGTTNSAGDSSTWKNLQIELNNRGTEYESAYVTAVDSIARKGLSSVSESNKNLWQEEPTIAINTSNGYQVVYLSEPLPAGTYNLSAVVTSTDTDKTVSTAQFITSNGNISHMLERNTRYGAAYVTTSETTAIAFYSSTTSALSAGDTSKWTDIQIEVGSKRTEYVPHKIIAKDDVARGLFDNVDSLEKSEKCNSIDSDVMWSILNEELYESVMKSYSEGIVTVPDGTIAAKIVNISGSSFKWRQLSDCVGKSVTWAINYPNTANNISKAIGHILYVSFESTITSITKPESATTGGVVISGTPYISKYVDYGDSAYVGQKESIRFLYSPTSECTKCYVYGVGKNGVGNSGTADVNLNIIDLTELFGSGNEPSLEECTEIFQNTVFKYHPTGIEHAAISAINIVKTSTTETIIIPDDIVDLDGYGWGIGAVHNTVDVASKKFIKRIGRVDLGTLTFYKQSNGVPGNFYCSIADAKIGSSSIFDRCSTITSGSISVEDGTCGFNKNQRNFYFTISEYDGYSTEQVKAALSGEYLYYELNTEKTVDISYELSINMLAKFYVTENDTIWFVNDYNVPVQHTIDYIVKSNLRNTVNSLSDELATITETGKNLYKGNDVEKTTTSSVYTEVTLDTPIPAGTYTLSAIVTYTATAHTVVKCNLRIRGASGEIAQAQIACGTGRTSTTFTVSEPITAIRFYGSTGTGTDYKVDTSKFENIQIEAGSVATAYAPYKRTAVDEIARAKKCTDTYYVSTTGSDSNNGSKASPFATIGKAIDAGARTVILEKGTYTENFRKTSDANVKILGNGSTIKYSNGASACLEFRLSHVEIYDLIFDASEATGSTSGLFLRDCTGNVENCKVTGSPYMGFRLDGSNVTITRCEASNCAVDGFNAHDTTSNVSEGTFIDCIAHNNGDDGLSYHEHGTIHVHSGKFYGNSSTGIAPHNGCNCEIVGAQIFGNGSGIECFNTNDTITPYPTMLVSGCVIRDNTSAESGRGYGISAKYYNAYITGCIITGNSAGDVASDASSTICR